MNLKSINTLANLINLCIPIAMISCGSNQVQIPQSSQLSNYPQKSANEECSQILEQSLFNEVKAGKNVFAKDVLEMEFYSLSEENAWEKFQEWKSKGLSGGGEVKIGFLDIFKGGLQGSSSESMTKDRFQEKFKLAKSQYQSKLFTGHLHDSTSNYSSYIRDAGSIDAWKTCVTKPRREPELICYGSRDHRNRAYIHVLYNGGIVAASNPKVNLSFPSQDVEINSHSLLLGNGNGKYFMLKELDSKGGDIPINAELPDGNTTFSCVATVPPAKEILDSCEIQRVRGLVSKWIDEEDFFVLKKSNWVPFKNQTSGNIGITNCETYKLNQ